MFGRPLTDEEVWNALPLSQKQRENIYNDFILEKKYDIRRTQPMVDVKKSFEEDRSYEETTPDETKEETKGED